MLAKKYKLTSSKDFDNVQKNGEVYQSTNFGLARVLRKDGAPSRFAFIVSTKIAKDAVDRNRVRRAMSEAVRLNSINLTEEYDVVFLAKISIARASTPEIMKEVSLALKQTDLLK
jgi:ribonuclease P protein component